MQRSVEVAVFATPGGAATLVAAPPPAILRPAAGRDRGGWGRASVRIGGKQMKHLVKASAAGLLVVGLAAAPACNRANDPKDQVSEALKNANIRDVDVDYDRDAKVIHLKGNVNDPSERQRAEDVAEKAVGTSGKVLNEVTVKGVDDRTADDNDGRIKDQLKDMVDRDPQLKQQDVTFDVNNGAVEVKGTVATAAEKNRITEIVRSVPGVKDVANGLDVKANANRRADTRTSKPANR
jgi:osmotically-inducible protein OsmY